MRDLKPNISLLSCVVLSLTFLMTRVHGPGLYPLIDLQEVSRDTQGSRNDGNTPLKFAYIYVASAFAQLCGGLLRKGEVAIRFWSYLYLVNCEEGYVRTHPSISIWILP